MTWKFIKIKIKLLLELVFGYRLTVGRQILVLNVGVRIPVPEPIPSKSYMIQVLLFFGFAYHPLPDLKLLTLHAAGRLSIFHIGEMQGE